jgi:hypothetical protein
MGGLNYMIPPTKPRHSVQKQRRTPLNNSRLQGDEFEKLEKVAEH